jgi:hypothetical protein
MFALVDILSAVDANNCVTGFSALAVGTIEESGFLVSAFFH